LELATILQKRYYLPGEIHVSRSGNAPQKAES
jgi:hypothetical protein